MILQRLRAQTQAQHEQIEQHMALLETTWTRDSYQTLLRRFYGFYAPLEPILWNRTEWIEHELQSQQRWKTPLLQRDLHFLGDTYSDIEQLPRCAPLPLTSWAQSLGCAYVLEGSTLGGQLLSRYFHRELGLQTANGLDFFTSYGAQTGAMWNEFRALLQHEAEESDDAFNSEIVQSAQTTFSTLDAWLHPDKL